MRKKYKALMIGPIAPPYNGQSISFSYLNESFNKNDFKIFNTTSYNNRYINFIRNWVSLPPLFFFSNFNKIYFTCSRTNFGFFKDLPIFILGFVFKIKIINHLHGADFNYFFNNSGFLKPLILFCYERVYKSIVLMESMKNEFKYFPNMSLEVVPNCYDNNFNNFNPSKFTLSNIIFLSNIMKSKGIIQFLDASEILLKENKSIKVFIAGGFLKDEFCSKKRIKYLFNKKYNKLRKLYKNRIKYYGVVEGVYKIELLLKSSIFVLPTFYRTEAFPISIIEAMKTGNAIVTTNHNYLNNIIDNKNGSIIKKKSVEDIVESISKLIDSPINLKKKQLHNINTAEKLYDYKIYIKNLKKIIKDE